MTGPRCPDTKQLFHYESLAHTVSFFYLQRQVLGELLLDHLVDVLEGVDADAEAEVVGEGLVGVVGGVQQLVHRLQLPRTHDGERQTLRSILPEL